MNDYSSMTSNELRAECKRRQLGSASYHGKSNEFMIEQLRQDDASKAKQYDAAKHLDDIKNIGKRLHAELGDYIDRNGGAGSKPTIGRAREVIRQGVTMIP